mmetsp:Transcript_95300/g.242147  ORF Transcript_95300/g.242147 Transcript_95300/m.242147 type:complete len:264 (+) Transcript_95300:734-1525(+)
MALPKEYVSPCSETTESRVRSSSSSSCRQRSPETEGPAPPRGSSARAGRGAEAPPEELSLRTFTVAMCCSTCASAASRVRTSRATRSRSSESSAPRCCCCESARSSRCWTLRLSRLTSSSIVPCSPRRSFTSVSNSSRNESSARCTAAMLCCLLCSSLATCRCTAAMLFAQSRAMSGDAPRSLVESSESAKIWAESLSKVTFVFRASSASRWRTNSSAMFDTSSRALASAVKAVSTERRSSFMRASSLRRAAERSSPSRWMSD